QVWTLVDLPYGKRAIGTKWIYRNKKNERGIVVRNKARLFLAHASFKDFIVYQMDVKSAFLYGKIKEKVYVYQPLGFEDPVFYDKVYKVEKALYGLHQAPRACNDEPQPSSDAVHKDDEGVSKESEIDNQEKPENSTQDVNTAEPSINTASTNVNTEVDLSNISNTYLVPSTLNTRIHKDHLLDHVNGDVQSGVLTMRTTKTTNDQGFISAVYEGKTHEYLHTCLFACFLSQEEPKKVIQALKDLSW
nr:hypothetical protein [Tanacetum cinerariifolium]